MFQVPYEEKEGSSDSFITVIAVRNRYPVSKHTLYLEHLVVSPQEDEHYGL